MVTVHFYSVAVTHTKNAPKPRNFHASARPKKIHRRKTDAVGFSLPQIDTHNTQHTATNSLHTVPQSVGNVLWTCGVPTAHKIYC
jgi:hypothetical protein